MKTEFFTAVLLLSGSAFIAIAALGLVRFPDLFTRMHAASKAGSLGLGCILAGVALAYPAPTVIVKCILVVLFTFLTAPVAAHMIGRAAYLLRVPLWKGTLYNELKGRYGKDLHTLDS